MTTYIVFTRESTTDQGEMDVYAKAAGPTLEGHPVTPLAFYGSLEVLEGSPIEGAVILSFPTTAAAHAWYDGPDYVAARQHRLAGADYRVFLIEGVDAPA